MKTSYRLFKCWPVERGLEVVVKRVGPLRVERPVPVAGKFAVDAPRG